MKVLIACEYSGAVRDAFAELGHYAVSCDLEPSDHEPKYGSHHHHGDVREIIGDPWDILIYHPPCTFLTCAAEWAYGDGPYHQKIKPETLVGQARRAARVEAIEFFKFFGEQKHIAKKCGENPVGVLSRHIGKPTQIIQPHMFGDDASKSTCLWLDGLPPPGKYYSSRGPNCRMAERVWENG